MVPNWNLWSFKFSILVFNYIYFGFIVLPHVELLTALFCVLWYWNFTQGSTRARQGFYQVIACIPQQCLVYLKKDTLLSCPDWPQTWNSPVSVSE